MSLLKSIAPKTSDVLGAGQHRCSVVSYQETNSFVKKDGSEKERKAPWADPTPELMVQFGAIDNTGVFTERYAFKGYVSAKDKNYVAQPGDIILSSTNEKGESYDEQYVCRKDANGVISRIESAEKTKTAQDIFARMVGTLKTGAEDCEVALQKAIANRKQFNLTITVAEKNGRMVLSGTKSGMPTVVAETAMIADGDL